jgi:hypothetical protein
MWQQLALAKTASPFIPVSKRGVKMVSPVWEASFKKNRAMWGDNVLKQCRSTEAIGVNTKYLWDVSDEMWKNALKSAGWKSMSSNGNAKAKGVFEEKSTAKNIWSLNNACQNSVSIY